MMNNTENLLLILAVHACDRWRRTAGCRQHEGPCAGKQRPRNDRHTGRQIC